MLNCFSLSVEPNINVDLKGNKKRSNSNVPQAYKLEFSHLKLSCISWSKTTLIIFVLLLWPTVYVSHNSVLSFLATTEMESSVPEASVVTLTPANTDTRQSSSPFLRTYKDMRHSTQMSFCNLCIKEQFTVNSFIFLLPYFYLKSNTCSLQKN